MSQDFVRRLPGLGVGVHRPNSWSERVHLDLPLVLLLFVVAAYGMLVLFTAADQEAEPLWNQFARVGLATLALVVLAQISPVFYLRVAPWAYALGIVFLVLVLLYGPVINGSRRWLRIPGFPGFQPSELMKLIIPLLLAWYFHDRHLPPKPRHLMWAMVMIVIPVMLILPQPDLGTALIVGASGFLVLLLAGMSWWVVWMGGLGALVSAPAMWFLLTAEQQQRILTFWDPERDPLGEGWQILQSKTAIGSGGLFGKGFGEGTQSHLDFLPYSRTDFIISVLGEEFGLLGIVILLVLYLLIIGRGLIIAVQAQDTFGRLLAGTITFSFFIYVFINIGMVSGLLPVVGVPLPLVSYGGTSMVTLFAGFGILMSVHTHRRITL